MPGTNRIKSNREFRDRLTKASLTYKIEWNRVRGHNGNTYQETADRLLRAAATRKGNLAKETLDRLASLMKLSPGRKHCFDNPRRAANSRGGVRQSQKS